MRWVTTRALRAIVTILIVINGSFFMIRWLPGGPEDYLRSQLLGPDSSKTQEEVDRIVENYLNVNPNKPVEEQYMSYMSQLLNGDMGRSIWYNEEVESLLATALPWTVFVMSISISLSFAIGILLGAGMAYFEGSLFDQGASIYSVVSTSIPYYVIAILAVWILGFTFEVFPAKGRFTPGTTAGFNYPFMAGVIQHATLPILSIVLTGFGAQALAMRANSVRVLGNDYLRVARLRGLSEGVIVSSYVARNAVLPLYTGLMIAIGAIFGGSVILEQIFVYQGAGFYLYKAALARDFPLMMGGFIIITTAVITGIFIAELTYGKIDPRADEGGTQNEAY